MGFLGSFNATAEQLGLPVKMLRFVEARYSMKTTTRDRSAADVQRDRLLINVDVYRALRSLGQENSDDGMIKKGVNDLYHEATHAYIDLKLEEETRFRVCEKQSPILRFSICQEPLPPSGARDAAVYVKSVMDEAAGHYFRTTIMDGSKERSAIPTKAWSIANEAAAMYIGERASVYWELVRALTGVLQEAQERLREIKGKPKSADPRALAKSVRESPTRALRAYEEATARRIWGYMPGCHWFWADWSGRQCLVTSPSMPPRLVQMCDEILERKIPNVGRAAPVIAKLERDIQQTAQRIEALGN